MRNNFRIINNGYKTYKCTDDIDSGVCVKKERNHDEYKVIREYNNLFTCPELVKRIIICHKEEDFRLMVDKKRAQNK